MKKRSPAVIKHKHKNIAVATPISKKGSLIIADDDEGIRDIFEIIFQRAGFAVELKENGDDLLQDRFSVPDLFLIDKQLSGVSGLEVCRHLKNTERTRNVPVILISASPDISRLYKECGADGFVEKPFEMQQLVKIVEMHIYKGKAKVH